MIATHCQFQLHGMSSPYRWTAPVAIGEGWFVDIDQLEGYIHFLNTRSRSVTVKEQMHLLLLDVIKLCVNQPSVSERDWEHLATRFAFPREDLFTQLEEWTESLLFMAWACAESNKSSTIDTRLVRSLVKLVPGFANVHWPVLEPTPRALEWLQHQLAQPRGQRLENILAQTKLWTELQSNWPDSARVRALIFNLQRDHQDKQTRWWTGFLSRPSSLSA